MSDETRGQGIKRRREAIGMSVTELAERSGMDWETVARAEDGASRGTTYVKLERVLDDVEEEIGGQPETEHSVEFLLEGNFGVRVRVKGPVDDLPALEASVARLIRQMSQPSEE